jgi:lipopolysaccharide assembly protein B
MQLDWTWFLLALPVAFGAGWLFSRLDVWHWRMESRHQPLAYFKGLNYLLTGEQDKAVDCFIEAVQNDPDTSELHFTLGNLFRRRGEYARAVRVHEHLLARADLSQADRDRAQFALAQDYWRAGLLDRAEAALRNGSDHELASVQAQELLLLIYERGRDWAGAVKVAQALGVATGQGNYRKRQAHYLCEQGRFLDALAVSPDSPRAYMALASTSAESGDAAQAFAHLCGAFEHAPQAAPLFAAQWLASAKQGAERTLAIAQLQDFYASSKNIDVLDALIECGALPKETAYHAHLAASPSLRVAQHLITAPEFQPALKAAVLPLSRYRCVACGFEAKQYFWQCPGCQAWDSYAFKRVEEL